MTFNDKNELIAIEMFGESIPVVHKAKSIVETFGYDIDTVEDLYEKIVDTDNAEITGLQLIEELNHKEIAFLASVGLSHLFRSLTDGEADG